MSDSHLLAPGALVTVKKSSDWKMAIWETSELNQLGFKSLLGFMVPGSIIFVIGINTNGNRWPYSVKVHTGNLIGWVSSENLVPVR